VAITERNHTISELQSQLTDLGTEILELRRATVEQQSKHAIIVDELEQRAAFGKREAENLSQDVETLVKERNALQEQLNEATENVETSVSRWEAECKETKEQLRLVQEELSMATTEKDETEMRAEQLLRQIEDLKEYRNVQESKAAEAMSAERQHREEAVASLDASLDELRAKVAEQAEEYAALERASKERQEEELSLVDELRKTADAQKVEIESLQQRIKSLVQKQDELTEQPATRTAIAEEEQQERSTSGGNLLREQNNTLRIENENLNSKIARIEKEHEVVQRELENVRIESEETIHLWTGKLKSQETIHYSAFFHLTLYFVLQNAWRSSMPWCKICKPI
jgi:hypothetical protein